MTERRSLWAQVQLGGEDHPQGDEDNALRVVNAEIINAYKFGGDSGRHWHIRVLPLSNKTITIDLPRTTDCADPGAVCTRDGRKLSDAYNWLFEPMNPDAVDNTPPALRRAEVDGATLMLLYYEGLDEASTPAADRFAVTVADAARSLASSDPVTVKGRRVMLTLAAAAAHGETVTVSYTAPGSNPLRDVAGNDAGGAERPGGDESHRRGGQLGADPAGRGGEHRLRHADLRRGAR